MVVCILILHEFHLYVGSYLKVKILYLHCSTPHSQGISPAHKKSGL